MIATADPFLALQCGQAGPLMVAGLVGRGGGRRLGLWAQCAVCSARHRAGTLLAFLHTFVGSSLDTVAPCCQRPGLLLTSALPLSHAATTVPTACMQSPQRFSCLSASVQLTPDAALACAAKPVVVSGVLWAQRFAGEGGACTSPDSGPAAVPFQLTLPETVMAVGGWEGWRVGAAVGRSSGGWQGGRLGVLLEGAGGDGREARPLLLHA